MQAVETLSGQTLEHSGYRFLIKLFSVGLNCSLGAKQLRPFIENYPILQNVTSALSNAGLPNAFGEYDENPRYNFIINKKISPKRICYMVGGCCGTTPDILEKLLRQSKVFRQGNSAGETVFAPKRLNR